MKKWVITLLLIITSIMFVAPINASALSISNTLKSVYVLKNLSDIDDVLDDYDQEQNCSVDNSILGDPDDPNSVAWLVQLILNVIKVVGPILVVILSSIDFIKVIVKSDDEAMSKAQKKLIMRLILVLLLFLIPTIVQVLLGMFNITSDPTCGLQ